MYKKIILIISTIIFISCSNSEYVGNSGTDQGKYSTHKTRVDGTDYIKLTNSNYNKTVAKPSTTNSKANTSTKSTAVTKPTTSSTSTLNTGTSDYKKPNVTDTKDYLFPVKNPSIKKAYKEGAYSGIDFNVSKNTEIYPVAPGMIIFADEKASLGKAIFIHHNNGYVSIYTNLEKLNYKKGDYVNSSKDIIARASESFGFEFRKRTQEGTVPLDPNKYLKKR